MKRRKLRGYVIPSICFILICTILFSSYKMYQILSSNKPTTDNYEYVTNPIIDEVTPTVKEETSQIIRPYTKTDVVATIPFYNINATEDQQTSSLIYYEGIYMQNTGVLYTSSEEFECVSILDGVVKNIKEDTIMGTIVEIENSNNLTTIYQSVKDVRVTIGSSVKQGDIIATSGANSLNPECPNNLHFEVFYKGQLVNPEEFYLYNAKEVME